jgi:outer membrane murein-binding lipoprotein Lpp
MHKYIIILVIGTVYLLSGCSLSHYYDGKSPIEIEQYENPMVWKEVVQIQVALWPLEKKVNKIEKNLNEVEKTVNGLEKNVNEMRDELATTKLSSIQANKDIESLQAEIQQIKSGSIRKEKTPVELPIEKKNKKEMLIMGTTKVAGESKKAGPDIQSIIINDIQYYKVSDTQDKVLIYVNAMNNPKLRTLRGENPRIVLDFLNTRNIDKEKYEINTDGNFIKRIRIRSYKKPMQKVRVVFDMMPNKKYSVDQKFSKKENIYSFDIKAK